MRCLGFGPATSALPTIPYILSCVDSDVWKLRVSPIAAISLFKVIFIRALGYVRLPSATGYSGLCTYVSYTYTHPAALPRVDASLPFPLWALRRASQASTHTVHVQYGIWWDARITGRPNGRCICSYKSSSYTPLTLDIFSQSLWLTSHIHAVKNVVSLRPTSSSCYQARQTSSVGTYCWSPCFAHLPRCDEHW